MDSDTKRATIALNDNGDRVLKIWFPYDLDLLDKVRSIPGRKYHKNIGCWSAPLHVATVETLKEWDFTFSDNLEAYLTKTKTRTRQIASIGIPGLKGKLYPFQNEGVAWIDSRNGRALIGDDMGLGKTVQALAWLQLHPERRPAIIVCPASVKMNWLKETLAWLPYPNVEVLTGTTTWIPTADIVIINYDILHAWVETLKRMKAMVLITDECHRYKDNKARMTKAVKRLAKSSRYFIALSGTPIVNRPIEIYNAVNIIQPDLFPDYWKFAQKYCKLKHNGFGWDFGGASHTDELHSILTQSIMIRRKKEDVLPDLPAKVRSFVPVQLHNTRDYLRAEADFISFIREVKGEVAAKKASNAEALAQIEVLKQLAVEGKMKEAIQWIHDFLNDTDQKLVIFAVHKFVIDTLMAEFNAKQVVAVKIDGSVPNAIRQEVVEQFQHNPKIRLFIGNIKAAGVGITLTASSNVMFLELPWTPGDLIQAEDRCHRIGQKSSVNIYYLLATKTIEEKIARLLDKKRKVLDAVLDGIETNEQTLLIELMNEYKKVKPIKTKQT